MNGPALVLLEQPLRFRTRKPLVHHLHRQTKLLVHALPEPRRLFGHIAACSIQTQRESHYNCAAVAAGRHIGLP